MSSCGFPLFGSFTVIELGQWYVFKGTEEFWEDLRGIFANALSSVSKLKFVGIYVAINLWFRIFRIMMKI